MNRPFLFRAIKQHAIQEKIIDAEFDFEKFHGLIPHLRPFIFHKQPDPTEARSEINLPFETCAFQLLNDETFSHFDSNGHDFDIKAIIVKEIRPHVFDIYSSGIASDGKTERCFFVSSTYDKLRPNGRVIYDQLYLRVQAFCQMLQTSCLGSEPSFERIKVRVNGQKQTIRIKDIVHVRPMRDFGKRIQGIHQDIDWSHRWEVRGHWRKCATIGKDRDGHYQVRGFTWVVPHEKGPEHKLLVKKSRLVEGGKNERIEAASAN